MMIKMYTEKQLELIRMGGAFIRCGKVFCICHSGAEINENGECDECRAVNSIAGAEMTEARAMAQAQDVYEDDNYFEES